MVKRKLQRTKLSSLTDTLRVLATDCQCQFVEHDLSPSQVKELMEGPVNPTPVGGTSPDASASSVSGGAGYGESPTPDTIQGPGDSSQPQEQDVEAPIKEDDGSTDFNPATAKEKKNKKSCLCASCPTYARGASEQKPQELTYCESGVSNLKPQMSGCLCCSCEVYKKSRFLGWYYCKTGRAEVVTDLTGIGEPEDVPPELASNASGSEMVPESPVIQNTSAPAVPVIGKP